MTPKDRDRQAHDYDVAALEAAHAKADEVEARWPRIRGLATALAELRQENNFAARLREAYRT